MDLQGFLSEDELRRYLNDGRITHLQFLLHNREKSSEFSSFCSERSLPMSEESAIAFFSYLNELEEDGHIEGID